MKIMLLSDMHLSNKSPVNRKDDYWYTVQRKLVQLGSIYRDNGCSCLLQAGDVFDKPSQPNEVVNWFVYFLNSYDIKLCCVYGQHDLYMRSYEDLAKTSLNLLNVAAPDRVHVFKEYLKTISASPKTCVYGVSYGRYSIMRSGLDRANGEVDHDGEMFNNALDDYDLKIMIIHKEIGSMPLFDGHELTAPRSFLMENPEFDLILCGDYHYPFEATVDGRRLVNTGCMVRRSIFPRDMEHKPKVGIYDTDTKEIEYHFLDILPPEEAFDMNKIYTMKYEYEGGRFHTFGKALVGTRTGANFLDNLRTAMDNNTISDAASAEIETAIIPGKE